jgi:hypothetical protein
MKHLEMSIRFVLKGFEGSSTSQRELHSAAKKAWEHQAVPDFCLGGTEFPKRYLGRGGAIPSREKEILARLFEEECSPAGPLCLTSSIGTHLDDQRS